MTDSSYVPVNDWRSLPHCFCHGEADPLLERFLKDHGCLALESIHERGVLAAHDNDPLLLAVKKELVNLYPLRIVGGHIAEEDQCAVHFSAKEAR